MKALTLHQPWAQLIAIGAMKIETRSWQTHYRGELAIHAAKMMPDYAKLACLDPVYIDIFEPMGYCRREGKHIIYKLPLGKVVAVAELIECVPVTPGFIAGLSQEERKIGDPELGTWAWTFDEIKTVKHPVPARGRLGLWNWDYEGI